MASKQRVTGSNPARDANLPSRSSSCMNLETLVVAPPLIYVATKTLIFSPRVLTPSSLKSLARASLVDRHHVADTSICTVKGILIANQNARNVAEARQQAMPISK